MMNSNAEVLLPNAPVVSDFYRNPATIAELRQQFKTNQFVKLCNFFLPQAYDMVVNNLAYLHSKRVRKNFIMPTFNSARSLSVVGGHRLVNLSLPLIALYSNMDLRESLSRITGAPIYTIRHEDEFMVANFLDGQGDTHGWHTDDPEYALIVITEAPPENCGGELEYIADWTNFCTLHGLDPTTQLDAAIELASALGALRSARLASGDCYLLNAAKALHRVTPINGGNRKALNMAFDTRQFRTYGETANLLYAS